MNEWIKMPRQLLEEMYEDSDSLRLWFHLLLHADQNGVVSTSLRELSEDTNLTIRSLRTRLRKYTERHTIDTQATQLKTIITICDYDSYIGCENGKRHTNDTLTTHSKNEEKETDKETKKETDKESSKEITKEIKKEIIKEKEERIVSPLNPPKGEKTFDWSILPSEYIPIVKDWLAYKREKSQTYKPIGFKALCKNLLKLSNGDPETARRIVEQSMLNNYAGLFPLKNNSTYGQRNSTSTADERLAKLADILIG